MKVYSTVKEDLYNDDFGQYTSYGIDVVCDKDTILHISDLSVDKKSVECFCSLLNSFEVDPNDIMDYVEEFLSKID